MKVLYDHQIFAKQKFGGISRYFNEMIKIQSEEFQVCKIEPYHFQGNIYGPTKTDLFSRGIRYLKRKTGFTDEMKKAVIPGSVRKIFRDGQFDIFHPTYYDPYFLDLTKKPFVLTVYDMIHEIYKEFFSTSDDTSFKKKLLCEKASKIITISNTTKSDLINIFNISEEKVCAIPLASDFDTITAIKPNEITGIENYILFVGARWLYKNFYFSVIALSDILKEDRTLQLVCTGHAFTKEELVFFKDLGIEGQVKHIFLRSDNELAWVYQNASLFIFPSLYEGFGFPILEAFARNCPVISSNKGSLFEVGGDAVVFFDPKNIIEIQEAAVSVLYNSNLRKKLIDQGKNQFQKFSWADCRAKTMEVYKSVILKNDNWDE